MRRKTIEDKEDDDVMDMLQISSLTLFALSTPLEAFQDPPSPEPLEQ